METLEGEEVLIRRIGIDDHYTERRLEMVERQLRRRGIADERVLAAALATLDAGRTGWLFTIAARLTASHYRKQQTAQKHTLTRTHEQSSPSTMWR